MTWSVSVYRRSGDAEVHEYTSHRLASPALVREHVDLARERPWVSRVALTEHVREVTRHAIAVSDLPVEASAATAPPAPAGGTVVARFYEIEGFPPVGPLSLDDVRERLLELHRGAAHAAGATEAGPAGLRLWEVTVVDFTRQTSDDAPPTRDDA
ncbi:hypothetical protein ACIP5N_21665 [Streptomyces sp. NPDC088768]|uniref:hypothetical protein n=1 Tax=Streptomyces sp. NPDC088768 TaxID=3365894 RepID=UPI0038266476